MRARRTLPAAATALMLALAACTGENREPEDDEEPEPQPLVAQAAAPEDTLVVPGEGPELAAGVARVFFETAPLVILSDAASQEEAVELAIEYGVPLLLSETSADPRGDEDGDGVADGPGERSEAATAEALDALGTDVLLTVGDPVMPAVGETEVLTDPGELPPTEPAEPAAGHVLAMTTGEEEQTAPVATARAAGAEVLAVPGAHPGATAELVEQVAQRAPEVVVGLGDAFGDAETLRWRSAAAATGVNLPGGGQRVFGDTLYVALYGSPISAALGALGEQDLTATIERVAEYAERYDALVDRRAVPALEIIVTVASGSPGDDGDYTNVWPAGDFRPYVDAAAEAGQYVVLDLQPGCQDFLTQARHYEELLLEPHVGLALDPEWRHEDCGPHDRIGQVHAEEVNEVVDYLAELTREHDLPEKMLILHAFQNRMIPDVGDVDLGRPEVSVLLHMDGQGGTGAKQDTWRTLRQHAPEMERWGWKNFYDEDHPMLTAEETIDQVDPIPDFISYQ